MPTDTTEAALEACIERFLTGDVSTPASNDGKVQEDPATYQAGKGIGYLRGRSSDFNAESAFGESKLWQAQFQFRRRLRFSISQTLSGFSSMMA